MKITKRSYKKKFEIVSIFVDIGIDKQISQS